MVHIIIFFHFICFALGIGLITYCYEQYRAQSDKLRKDILICEIVFLLMFFLDTMLVYIRNILQNLNLDSFFNWINYALFFLIARYIAIIIREIRKEKNQYGRTVLEKILIGGSVLVFACYAVSSWISSLQRLPLLCVLYLLQGSFILVSYRSKKIQEQKLASKKEHSLIIESEEPKGIEERINKIENLTKREKEIIIHIYQGMSNKEIGECLFISPNTVKNHIYNIYKKLGVKNKIELVSLINKAI